ncbi:riboflavin synthase [Planctomicrobium sp. SH664]|uniref:riboflavin synthase n=1 Tax=Planctomicrobium sp. SH664 TaxID=3448125 RepID=UPI003F5C77BE
MFTGLVEGFGTVTALRPQGAAIEISVRPGADFPRQDDVQLGDSVAINGCCLTVIRIEANEWSFQAGSETLSRTNLGQLQTGSLVNLERSVRASDRLGGHIVQGHVDALGQVDGVLQEGDWTTMWFQVPAALTRQMVSKGSITVDGVSLTLVNVEADRFSVALIPHTLQHTTLGRRRVGDLVNIETDIIGKYLEKMMGNMSMTEGIYPRTS